MADSEGASADNVGSQGAALANPFMPFTPSLQTVFASSTTPLLDDSDHAGDSAALPAPTPDNNRPIALPSAASSKAAPLRGVGLLAVVFAELSAQLGKDFSTAELMKAAQQLIDISKSEYVSETYKEVAEREGYYSWNLVRAFGSHAWQIAGTETDIISHCDADDFSPETVCNARLIQNGWNERMWEF